MRLIAFLLLFLILCGFGLMVAIVLYHLREYAVPGDKTRLVRKIFLIGTTAFVLATLILFLAIPWGSVAPSPIFS